MSVKDPRPYLQLNTWLNRWGLLLLVILALGLRFYRLDGQSYWYDEGTSVVLAVRDLPTITRDAAADIHPPLYYYLLHFWVGVFGQSEMGSRSLSVLLGVALVLLTWAIARRLFDPTTALAAGVLVAVSPFAVYYAQETRMYTLAAVMGAACFLAMLWVVERLEIRDGRLGAIIFPPLLIYILTAIGALYTHYFAFTAPLAANVVVGVWVLRRRAWREALVWTGAQLVVAAVFLPWLLRSLEGIQNWPAVSQPFTLDFLLLDSLRVFSLGRGTAWSPWAWLFAVLLVCGLALRPPPLATQGGDPPPSPVGKGGGGLGLPSRLTGFLYLAIPLVVMFVLSLRRPLYNPKFLLVALPPFAILVAYGALVVGRWFMRPGRVISLGLMTALIVISGYGLWGYYFDPKQARDDYRGISRYVQAAGRPGDGILVNAPSQVEVFGLYYTGDVPVYPIPRRRPPDKKETEAELAQLAAQHQRLFGLFWATNESDPQGVVEGWLREHGYKAMDSWWGNLRLTLYALPPTSGDWQPTTARFGERVALQASRLSAKSVEAGDVLPIGLRWMAETAIPADLKVFVHLIDGRGLIIGQHDAPPAGQPTTGWSAGASRDDNHGILVPFGTPPGEAEIRVGLYDVATGGRLRLTSGEDYLVLGKVAIQRPASPPPIEVFNLPYRSGAQVGDLTLLGYAYHKRGFDHAPDEPIHPGDEIQVTLVWQARTAAPRLPDATIQQGLTLGLGSVPGATIVTPGGVYALSQWQAGETVRSIYLVPVPASLVPGPYPLLLRGGVSFELNKVHIVP